MHTPLKYFKKYRNQGQTLKILQVFNRIQWRSCQQEQLLRLTLCFLTISSDVLRVCFYEIANHAKINGAIEVFFFWEIFFARLFKCILFLALPAPTLMSAVHLSKEDTTRGRIRRNTHLHAHWWSNVQCVYKLLS